MVNLMLLSPATSIPPDLAAQLVPNDPVNAVHWWPIGLGYWILLFLFIVAVITTIKMNQKFTPYRRYISYLEDIKQTPSHKHHKQVHLLLRKVLQDNDVKLASVNDREFAGKVKASLQLESAPTWVNAHYAKKESAQAINWNQVKLLIKLWSQESAK